MYFSTENDSITPCGGFIHSDRSSSSSAPAADKRDHRRRANYILSNTISKDHFNGEETKLTFESTCVSQSADNWFAEIQSRYCSSRATVDHSLNFDCTVSEPSGKQLPRSVRRRDFTGTHNKNSGSSSNNNNNNINNNNYGGSGSGGHSNGRHQMQSHQQQFIFAPKSRGGGNGGLDKRQGRQRQDGYQRGVGAAAPTSHTGLDEYDERRRSDDGSDFEVEWNSIYLPGSKKQNLNHLLNFNYAPRERHDATTLMRSGNNAKGHGYVKRIKYNKEQFLQAKYVTASQLVRPYLSLIDDFPLFHFAAVNLW